MRGFSWLPLVLLASTATVSAQDRLELEVLPIYVHMITPVGFEVVPEPGSLYRGMAMVHEGLATLGVPGGTVDVVLSIDSDVFVCESDRSDQVGYSSCQSESLSGNAFPYTGVAAGIISRSAQRLDVPAMTS